MGSRVALAALVLIATACGPSSEPATSPARTALLPPAVSGTARVTATGAPTPISSTVPTFVAVSAPSANVVWAFVGGSRLFRSTDTGNSWDERALPSGITTGEVSFLDEREGWLLAPMTAAADCASQRFTVFHTADRASTWQRVLLSDAADPRCKSGLAFTDPQRGWITLTAPNNAPQIARTADAGETWQLSFALPAPPAHRFGVGAAPAAGRVKVFGGVLLMSAFATSTKDGGVYASVYRSTSNGAFWDFVATAPDQTAPIAFVTGTRWLATLPSGTWRETTNAGATWHDFASDYPQIAPAAPELVFADASVGYAIFRGQIQRTTDGGAHWTATKAPGA